MSAALHVLALSGGVGGAKLALGLQRVLPAGALTVIANTGDDFKHMGLAISPDVDTTLYTLAGLVNPETGWGGIRRPGISCRRWSVWAARRGSASVIAIWPCMWSGRDVSTMASLSILSCEASGVA